MSKNKIDAADYATPGSIEPLKSLPTGAGSNYIAESGGDYVVSDRVMGSLAGFGQADFFTIRGESAENVIYISPKP